MADPENSASIASEEALLQQARSGNQDAFGELMTLHYEPVFRLVHAIVRNEHDARDVCQEVWVRAWQKIASFRGEAKLATWLHPIAVRRAVDHLRKRRRWYDRFIPFSLGSASEREEFPSVPEPAATDADPRDALEAADRRQRFERALAALPPKHRAVLALRELQGLSYEEISNTVKCRPGTVMSRLFHARRMLARKLEEMPCD